MIENDERHGAIARLTDEFVNDLVDMVPLNSWPHLDSFVELLDELGFEIAAFDLRERMATL